MFSSFLISNKRGFSIIMALGATGVLLIVVVGLAGLYINEMRLSRMQYDQVLTWSQAEGAFEYAQLKIKNHRDGFEDRVTYDDLDGKMMTGNTSRTDGIKTNYQIIAQSGSYTADMAAGDYIILPLFVGTGHIISNESVDPNVNTGTTAVKNLSVTLSDGTASDLSWSIVAMSGSESVGITGIGDINGSTIGNMRIRDVDCYRYDGVQLPSAKDSLTRTCDMSLLNNGAQLGEEIEYFYDLNDKVSDFLKADGTAANQFASATMKVTDPFLLLYTSGALTLTVNGNGQSFTLPERIIYAESQKGDALQRIEFKESKAGYYDALKYSVFNTAP